MDYRAEYQKWLTEFVGDKATIDELKSLEGDEREIEDRFYTELAVRHRGYARRYRRGS